MANTYFSFKSFTIHQDRCAMKVTTDACLFGAWCAEEIKKQPAENLLDIGTGTGLLSLMIAQKNAVAIDAVEIDAEATEQARENIEASPFKGITVHKQNVLDFELPKYDCIVSNPPFYENELSSPSATKNVAHHSSELNWKNLFELIAKHLNPKGRFFLLLPYKRKQEIEGLLMVNHLYLERVAIVRNSEGHSPFRLMIAGANYPCSLEEEEEEVVIKEGNHYTDAFKALLKDYYLHL